MEKTLLQTMMPEELSTCLPEYKQTILDQGIALAKHETGKAMAARRFDLVVIAYLTGLTLEQVNAILADTTNAA